ncbi:hypothetical protein D2T33_15930 [Sinirhodobacter populi]|uniref:Uncharacterized protein n=1 Tax=Paenirhodobacter populi TaxID=2306993 RepID=A0A443INX0_9RHOB|nr:hypothetical protein D2T33_15930 [Sinirhodobacter populi]
MRVKCIKIINPNTGNEQASSPWLTVGKEYVVWEVSWGVNQKLIEFRFEHDDANSPALSNANLFELTSDYIPSTWSIRSIPDQRFSIGPRSWQMDGFWVAYFDGEPWARELYQCEVKSMLEEEQAYLGKLP